MKKNIAVLLLCVFALCAASCGVKQPVETTTESQTEAETDPAATEPEIGRIGEKGTFYVYIPEHWCKIEYSADNTRLRMFDIPSAPKIEEGKTNEVEIVVEPVAGKQEDVDAYVAQLLKIEGAKKGKDTKIDGYTFQVVTYTDPEENRTYTVYTGLGYGRFATITFKGFLPTEEKPAEILRSISFKAKPDPQTTAASTTKKAASTEKNLSTTKAASVNADAASKSTTAAKAEKTTAKKG